MLWYIMVCSMIGGISVSVTTGLGAAIVTSAQGDNQVGLRSRTSNVLLNAAVVVQALVHLFLIGIYNRHPAYVCFTHLYYTALAYV